MKRFFAIIILLTAGALIVFPGVSHADSYDYLTLTDYDGFDVVYNDYYIYDESGVATVNPTPTSEAAYIYYKTVEEDGLNVTSYQVFNVGFDPIDNDTDFPPISMLMIPMTDDFGEPIIDVNAYTFGTPEPDDYITVDDWRPYVVSFLFDGGLPKDSYSGIFTVTTALFVHEGDTVLAQLWDGGESTNANLTFALHLAKEDPGTPMPEPLTVSIDIKPGSDPNSINPKSKGKIPVAILSTMDFYAPAEVETESLTFGATGDEHSLAFCNPSPEDVNNDGYDDLVCHFYTQETDFPCGDEECFLKGQTVDEVPIEGSDSVRIVPSACKD